MVEILSKFSYPNNWNKKRQSQRPTHLRVFDYDKNYDWDTIWNDAIQINNDTILLIGPPLYQDSIWIKANNKILTNDLLPLSVDSIELDRVCLTTIKVNKSVDELLITNDIDTNRIKINQPSWDFANKTVIVTISRNHPISWLKQWIDYHKTVHRIDGLLLYNNQSTLYTSSQLEAAISRPDVTIKVVDYDVPFGCMGGGDWEWEGKSGNYLPWDSDFSQYVMLEHAKWRYLHCAKLAINADTDELLYINGYTLDEVAAMCEHSNNSVWIYKGTWIEPIDSYTGIIARDVQFDERKFNHYWKTAHSNQRGIGIKWMLNPKKNMNYQWHLHKTFGPHMMTNEIGFGHYLAMNTSWSWKRDDFVGDKSKLQEHTILKRALDKWQGK